MPTCPICNNSVSIFHWDIFGRGCTACTGIDPAALEDLLSEPCPQCSGHATFGTTAPALAYVKTKNGVVPAKAAPGLFIIGCSDCGHAWFRFNSTGAAALASAPGWIGKDQLSKLRGEHSFNCPACGQAIDLKTPSGVRISDTSPWRVYCEQCNEEIREVFSG